MKKYFTWQNILGSAIILYGIAIILKDLGFVHFDEPARGMIFVAMYAGLVLSKDNKIKEKKEKS